MGFASAIASEEARTTRRRTIAASITHAQYGSQLCCAQSRQCRHFDQKFQKRDLSRAVRATAPGIGGHSPVIIAPGSIRPNALPSCSKIVTRPRLFSVTRRVRGITRPSSSE